MYQRIIPRREGAVVAEIAAGHLRVSGKPLRVVVQALAHAAVGREAGLAARREATAELTLGNHRRCRRQVDQHPVEEVHARQVGRNLAPGHVDTVGLAGHVEIVADEHHRLRASGQVAPGQVRVQVVAEGGATGAVGAACGIAHRDAVAIGPAVAPELHRRDSSVRRAGGAAACAARRRISNTPHHGHAGSVRAAQHFHHRP